MSLRKEVRQFRKIFEEWKEKAALEKSVYRDLIDQQHQLIEELSNRLLARDLPELITYKLQPGSETTAGNIEPESLYNEDLIGSIAQVEQPE